MFRKVRNFYYLEALYSHMGPIDFYVRVKDIIDNYTLLDKIADWMFRAWKRRF
jgi:hypothetical protein